MKIAVRIGFAPPVLVSSVLYIIKDSELKELTGKKSSTESWKLSLSCIIIIISEVLISEEIRYM